MHQQPPQINKSPNRIIKHAQGKIKTPDGKYPPNTKAYKDVKPSTTSLPSAISWTQTLTPLGPTGNSA